MSEEVRIREMTVYDGDWIMLVRKGAPPKPIGPSPPPPTAEEMARRPDQIPFVMINGDISDIIVVHRKKGEAPPAEARDSP